MYSNDLAVTASTRAPLNSPHNQYSVGAAVFKYTKYTNTQIHKYTNTQIHKYSVGTAAVFKYTHKIIFSIAKLGHRQSD